MFANVLHPPHRSLLDRAMALVAALVLVFLFSSVWAFAAATGRPPAAQPRTASHGLIQCTTDDGTVVLVGEIVAAVSDR